MKIKKSDIVREALKDGDFKKALKIAKDFRINISQEQRNIMSVAYECMIYPEFYAQIGTDISKAIEKGKELVISLYGDKVCWKGPHDNLNI